MNGFSGPADQGVQNALNLVMVISTDNPSGWAYALRSVFDSENQPVGVPDSTQAYSLKTQGTEKAVPGELSTAFL